jgi:hypothetical protein
MSLPVLARRFLSHAVSLSICLAQQDTRQDRTGKKTREKTRHAKDKITTPTKITEREKTSFSSKTENNNNSHLSTKHATRQDHNNTAQQTTMQETTQHRIPNTHTKIKK